MNSRLVMKNRSIKMNNRKGNTTICASEQIHKNKYSGNFGSKYGIGKNS